MTAPSRALLFLSATLAFTWACQTPRKPNSSPNAGNGSVVGPLLAHLGIHLDNVFRASTVGDGVAPLMVTALGMAASAILLICTGQLRSGTAVGTFDAAA
jgi:hypothetical protein